MSKSANRSNRRQFLASAAASVAAASVGTNFALAQEEAAKETKRSISNPIGVSTYSFWQFRRHPELRSIEKCLELAADMGFDGVEILKVQMEGEPTNAQLQKIKQRAFTLGLDLMGYSTHQSFVKPDKAERQKNVDATIDMIEEAYRLGIPTLRINTGRWGTSGSFDELMANKGIEPTLEGYTDDEGFKWVIDSMEKLIPKAEKCGVTMGLENHWGLGRTAEGVMRVVDAVDSPWLQVTMDTGNFFEDRERQLKMLAPHAVLLQAKTYYGGGTWYTLDIDYADIAKIMEDAGYRGYVSLEFEGKDDPIESVKKSLEMLRSHFS